MITLAPAIHEAFQAAAVWADRLGAEFASLDRFHGHQRDAEKAAAIDWQLFRSAAAPAIRDVPVRLKRCLAAYFRARWVCAVHAARQAGNGSPKRVAVQAMGSVEAAAAVLK